jgi:hypothetical protein
MTARTGHGAALAWALAALLIAIPASAEEPRQGEETESKETAEQAQQVTLKSKKPSSGKNSLAAAASKIRLQRPEGEGSSAFVITDENLKRVSSKGNVSVAGGGQAAAEPGAATGSAAGTATAAGEENPANAVVQQYQEQTRTVRGLEERLKLYDEQLEEPSRDAHYPYTHRSPHLRAGGQQDRATAKRDEVAKQLEQEKKKLDAIRSQARREGIQLQ